ncbi:MAG TPA: glycosyltransferase family 2 protein [Thermodesulfovibrionales bacterium]|nr:glycosyltransferase family 2 protein [Thermodesulfovibrionales bacterium]
MNPFSVFIPVYNEEEIIVPNTDRLITYLDTLNTPYEIVIVSNGSTDKTPDLGTELQKKHERVKFRHIAEKGPGGAIGTGVSMAAFENIISVDMDLSVDLHFIDKANALLSLGYDVVVGSKRMGAQKRSFIRKTASTAFIMSAMLLLGLSFDDYSIAAKAYRKHVLERFKDSLVGGTFYVIELLFNATRSNYDVVEIPAGCRDERKSKFNLMHEGIYRFSKLYNLWLKSVILKKQN